MFEIVGALVIVVVVGILLLLSGTLFRDHIK